MTTEQQDPIQPILDQLTAANAILSIIATELRNIARALAPAAPNYHHRLADYHTFDWSAIGATVIAEDADGVSAVHCNGYNWTRRSKGGKFGDAIWYSRPNGKDDAGDVIYLRLITFKDTTPAEPLPFQPTTSDRPPTTSNQPPTTADQPPTTSDQLDPAAANHLTYTNGAPVPANDATIHIFNAFLAAESRKPADSAELKAWHQQQAKEEAK